MGLAELWQVWGESAKSLCLCLEGPGKLWYFAPPPAGRSHRSHLQVPFAPDNGRCCQRGAEDSSSRSQVTSSWQDGGQADSAGLEGGQDWVSPDCPCPSCLPGQDRAHGCASLSASLRLF